MTIRVHVFFGGGDFFLPTLPYGCRAACEHIPPGGIFFIFENCHYNVISSAVRQSGYQVSVSLISACYMMPSILYISHRGFQQANPFRFFGYTERQSHRVSRLHVITVTSLFTIVEFFVDNVSGLFCKRGVFFRFFAFSENFRKERHKLIMPKQIHRRDERNRNPFIESSRYVWNHAYGGTPISVQSERENTVFRLSRQIFHPFFIISVVFFDNSRISVPFIRKFAD